MKRLAMKTGASSTPASCKTCKTQTSTSETASQKLPKQDHNRVQDMCTRLLSANLDFDSELQHVFCWAPDECRDSQVFHVDRVCFRLCWALFSCLAWVQRTLHVVGSFLMRTHVFPVTVCCSPGSRGNSRVVGIVAVWSTAVEIC